GTRGNPPSAGVLPLYGPPPDNPPKITAALSFEVFAGQTQNHDFIVTRGGGQSVTVSVTGANFVTLTEKGNDIYTLRLAPGAGDVGVYTLVITAGNDNRRVGAPPRMVTLLPEPKRSAGKLKFDRIN